jgi:hypothetical protein
MKMQNNALKYFKQNKLSDSDDNEAKILYEKIKYLYDFRKLNDKEKYLLVSILRIYLNIILLDGE